MKPLTGTSSFVAPSYPGKLDPDLRPSLDDCPNRHHKSTSYYSPNAKDLTYLLVNIPNMEDLTGKTCHILPFGAKKDVSRVDGDANTLNNRNSQLKHIQTKTKNHRLEILETWKKHYSHSTITFNLTLLLHLFRKTPVKSDTNGKKTPIIY